MCDKKEHQRKIIVSACFGSLLLALYFLIFSFSEQDGEQSGNLSALISAKCVEILNALTGRNWTQAMMTNMAAYFENPLRKLAHFAEYTLMGMLVYGMWSPWIHKGKKRNVLVVFWVFVSAATDEFHQLFVPGRCGSVMDVLLDACGGIFGVVFLILLGKIRKV